MPFRTQLFSSPNARPPLAVSQRARPPRFRQAGKDDFLIIQAHNHPQPPSSMPLNPDRIGEPDSAHLFRSPAHGLPPCQFPPIPPHAQTNESSIRHRTGRTRNRQPIPAGWRVQGQKTSYWLSASNAPPSSSVCVFGLSCGSMRPLPRRCFRHPPWSSPLPFRLIRVFRG